MKHILHIGTTLLFILIRDMFIYVITISMLMSKIKVILTMKWWLEVSISFCTRYNNKYKEINDNTKEENIISKSLLTRMRTGQCHNERLLYE